MDGALWIDWMVPHAAPWLNSSSVRAALPTPWHPTLGSMRRTGHAAAWSGMRRVEQHAPHGACPVCGRRAPPSSNSCQRRGRRRRRRAPQPRPRQLIPANLKRSHPPRPRQAPSTPPGCAAARAGRRPAGAAARGSRPGCNQTPLDCADPGPARHHGFKPTIKHGRQAARAKHAAARALTWQLP